MFLSPGLSSALDRIAERAADVRRAYTPGAIPQHDDVATAASTSDFSLDPLAVVVPDGTYLVTADDRDRRAYTRNGALALRGGRLVDASGHAIYGRREPDGPLVELAVDRLDAALARVRDPSVEADGTFVYRREVVDPRSGAREQQRVPAGRVVLTRFPAGTKLRTSDGSHVTIASGVPSQEGFPGDGTFGNLSPMHRERSRIDVDESLARLKEAYLAFDALAAAEAAKMHVGKTMMDIVK
jgi:flagellar basal body rod protein FlgG